MKFFKKQAQPWARRAFETPCPFSLVDKMQFCINLRKFAALADCRRSEQMQSLSMR